MHYEALLAAGGIAAIRGALIDDCALGKNLKRVGPIWLGLTERVHSLRPYGEFGDIRRMVARSAYAQLHYSPVLLAATIAGMVLTYLTPPLLALFGSGATQLAAAAAWGLMTLSFLPNLRFYRQSPLWALALPGIALAYMAFTLNSAYQHARGRAGYGRGAYRPTHRGCDDGGCRSAFRQGPSRREFSGRLVAHPIRAIARPSWRSTNSSASPTTSPIMRRCRRPRSSSCSIGWRTACTGKADERAGRRTAARRAGERTPFRRVTRRICSPRSAWTSTKLRYRDWDDLIHYCSYSAMPVGRFVLDVHGESRATWPATDALCAALQIINHLQDCAADYRNLDRVYIPQDALRPAWHQGRGAG